ncbi:MAG: hypothetical protein ACREIV_12055 [Planctomycetaceae bacterium]
MFRSNPPPGGDEITVSVDNRNFYDATVYVRWQSNRQRVGVVTGHARGTFTVPWRSPQIQVEVELLAGGRLGGDRVSVSPGDAVEVEVPAQPGRLLTRIR